MTGQMMVTDIYYRPSVLSIYLLCVCVNVCACTCVCGCMFMCTPRGLLLPWCLTARLGQLTDGPQRSTHFCPLSPKLQAHTTMPSSFTGFWGSNSGPSARKANTALSHLSRSQVTHQCIVNQAAVRLNPERVFEAVSASGHYRQ